MAVDYIKVFTVAGSYIDKVNDYYSYIATFNEDKDDIDAVLSNQSLVRLGDGLTGIYDSFKQTVSSWTNNLINQITDVFTDEILIGANFPFGSATSLDEVWPALIHDMVLNSKTVDSSTSIVGFINYDTANSDVGRLIVGTKLDGVTPPIDGSLAIREYVGLTTQLTPDYEELTFTCTNDSENNGIRGSETFAITGTLSGSDPFAPGGENIGQLATIQAADNAGGQYISNGSFDNWTNGIPDGWELTSGTLIADIAKGSVVVYGNGSSYQTNSNNNIATIRTALNANSFVRNKAYWLTGWAAKNINLASNTTLELTIYDNNGNWSGASINVTPTGTAWEFFSLQFIPPSEIVGNVWLQIASEDLVANDPVILDNLVITPCEYHAGVAVAIFSGPNKFLLGDKISVPLSNDADGKFQAFFRKAYKIQLPSSNTPSIPENLVI